MSNDMFDGYDDAGTDSRGGVGIPDGDKIAIIKAIDMNYRGKPGGNKFDTPAVRVAYEFTETVDGTSMSSSGDKLFFISPKKNETDGQKINRRIALSDLKMLIFVALGKTEMSRNEFEDALSDGELVGLPFGVRTVWTERYDKVKKCLDPTKASLEFIAYFQADATKTDDGHEVYLQADGKPLAMPYSPDKLSPKMRMKLFDPEKAKAAERGDSGGYNSGNQNDPDDFDDEIPF